MKACGFRADVNFIQDAQSKDAGGMQAMILFPMTQFEAIPQHGKERRLQAFSPPHLSPDPEALATSHTVFENENFLISVVARTN